MLKKFFLVAIKFLYINIKIPRRLLKFGGLGVLPPQHPTLHGPVSSLRHCRFSSRERDLFLFACANVKYVVTMFCDCTLMAAEEDVTSIFKCYLV